MTELIAKPIVKNKFWIVEDHGSKVATIQAVEDGGFVYVHNTERKMFPTIKLLSKEFNVTFETTLPKKEKSDEHLCYDYPCNGRPYNGLWDVKHQFPVYTKTSKSKSFFCAGYYIIKFNNGWVKSYCPKFITLNRYEYQGPFKSKAEMQEALRIAK